MIDLKCGCLIAVHKKSRSFYFLSASEGCGSKNFCLGKVHGFKLHPSGNGFIVPKEILDIKK